MVSRKTIAVVGAAGAQGGRLVRAILNDPDGAFHAGALTRARCRCVARMIPAGPDRVLTDAELRGRLRSLPALGPGGPAPLVHVLDLQHGAVERQQREAVDAPRLQHGHLVRCCR
jgi:hypothetical protein